MKWIGGALALLLAGFLFQLSMLVYSMYILLAVLLLSRYLSRRYLDGVVAARICTADRAEIGETVKIEVNIANRGRLSIPWLLCEDFLPRAALVQNPPALEVKGPRLLLLRLKRGEERTIEYTLKCQRRGYYQAGPLLMESGDLFGLHRRFRIATDPAYILVLPRIVPLSNYDVASPRPLGEIRVTHRLYEDPTLVMGIRPYENGQPLNRIHWRASARTGDLQLKVFQPSAVSGATILLDFHVNQFRGHGAAFREELAIVAAASIASALLELGQRFGLVSNGYDAAERVKQHGWQRLFLRRASAQDEAAKEDDNERIDPIAIPPGRGHPHFEHILQTLARLELTDLLRLTDLVHSNTSSLSRSTTILAIVSAVDIQTAAALASLKERGYHVIAIVICFDEPALSDWAKPPEWVELLSDHNVSFHRVENDETLQRLCTELLV